MESLIFDKEDVLVLLDEMLASHGPIGDEHEIDAVVLREFNASGARTWQDGMGNIVAHLPGEGPRVMVAAHKDELGLIITHIRDDGSLKVKPLAAPFPGSMARGRWTSSPMTGASSAPSCPLVPITP